MIPSPRGAGVASRALDGAGGLKHQKDRGGRLQNSHGVQQSGDAAQTWNKGVKTPLSQTQPSDASAAPHTIIIGAYTQEGVRYVRNKIQEKRAPLIFNDIQHPGTAHHAKSLACPSL